LEKSKSAGAQDFEAEPQKKKERLQQKATGFPHIGRQSRDTTERSGVFVVFLMY